jgi:sec-independent protein translocase protein TatA
LIDAREPRVTPNRRLPKKEGRFLMLGLGMQELVIILIIVIVLFGATRLPQIGKGIGEAIRNFKKATNEPEEIDVTPKKPMAEGKETSDKEGPKKST